ncbi:MAG: hypothetical protein KAH00_00710 [Cocleimonas sp.]|nr:hypothetical protein [Cocleimonas sp.]
MFDIIVFGQIKAASFVDVVHLYLIGEYMKKLIYAIITAVLILLMYPIEGMT